MGPRPENDPPARLALASRCRVWRRPRVFRVTTRPLVAGAPGPEGKPGDSPGCCSPDPVLALTGVTKYLVERYLPGMTADRLDAVSARLVAATRELAVHGVAVRYVGSTFVPKEESCFRRFEGTSADEVRLVCEQARVPYACILETHDLVPGAGSGGERWSPS